LANGSTKANWLTPSHAEFATANMCGLSPNSVAAYPQNPHHSLARKVSDEFTVPLCRGHHRIVAVTKQRGGKEPASIRRLPPARYG
jgi:hypothetical protein